MGYDGVIMKMIDLTDTKFGRLTAMRYVAGSKSLWECRCDCGALFVASGKRLRNGQTRSCGCLRAEMAKLRFTKHGMNRTVEYRAWLGMRARCAAPRGRNHEYYGSKGIAVCPEWDDFAVFYKDMGARPSESHSVDRIDVTKGYCKENCRWATATEQARNKNNSVTLVYRGVPLNAVEIAQYLGLNYYTMREKLDRAIGLEKGRTKEESL